MKRYRIAAILCLMLATTGWGDEMTGTFKAGFAQRDITPKESVPLWGYARENRSENMSTGVLDPLYAKALVIQAGDAKLAIVATDLGRPPGEAMIAAIREHVSATLGINHLLICATHTHHGPVLELKDREGMGKGIYDAAFRYYDDLKQNIIDAITEAASNTQDTRIGWDTQPCALNRNRHSSIDPAPCDRDLTVVRIDTLAGDPLVIMVNYQAHPTVHPPQNNRFTAEYPGVMAKAVEAALHAPCMFIQGAAGDLQCEMDDEQWGKHDFIQEIGQQLAEAVLTIAATVETTLPATPSIQGDMQLFPCEMRLDPSDPGLQGVFAEAFSPELAHCVAQKYHDKTMQPKLTTVLLNSSLYFVGVSGEFFCQHGISLKQRIQGATVIFAGYCNGHDMYFPTIQAAAEGGYGADPMVAWAALGTAESMMDSAVIQFYDFEGKYKDAAASN